MRAEAGAFCDEQIIRFLLKNKLIIGSDVVRHGDSRLHNPFIIRCTFHINCLRSFASLQLENKLH